VFVFFKALLRPTISSAEVYRRNNKKKTWWLASVFEEQHRWMELLFVQLRRFYSEV